MPVGSAPPLPPLLSPPVPAAVVPLEVATPLPLALLTEPVAVAPPPPSLFESDSAGAHEIAAQLARVTQKASRLNV
ncbi:hypothetical protein SOCE26_004110 [Sorangium cellulosum]|uniref:Uncharacterized protein n=1 Tax=Sorangium cellulosum TaxID=56 RepID=A0A2L0EIA6_SORCE|nr:hypothetical protein SOCE26_004110 [Sorangium cellulosum]